MVQNVIVVADEVNNETTIKTKIDHTVCAGFFNTVAHTVLNSP